MRYFSKDHPRCRSPQGVMSCDEIRYWIGALVKEHGWRMKALARFLGFAGHGAMKSKLKASWIYPGEQLRVSRQLNRIISGEVVCQQVTALRFDAVVATHRVPLRKPMCWKFDLTSGRVRLFTQRLAPRHKGIPNFAALGG